MAHFYDTTGHPQHQVLNAKQTKEQGKDVFRDTTIADARKHGWFPGFTAIGGQFDKPGLNAWKQDQMWKVLLANPYDPASIEEPNDYRQRINKILKKELEQYQRLGSKVHDLIKHWLYDRIDPKPNPKPSPALACVSNFIEWFHANVAKVVASEQTFCSPEWGYGGAVDLQYIDAGTNRDAIVDYKTKRTTEGVKIVQGLEQKRQLTAYALGLGKVTWKSINTPISPHGSDLFVAATKESLNFPILGNLYLSTTESRRWEYIGVPPEEIPDLILDVRDCVRLWNRENLFGPYALAKRGHKQSTD